MPRAIAAVNSAVLLRDLVGGAACEPPTPHQDGGGLTGRAHVRGHGRPASALHRLCIPLVVTVGFVSKLWSISYTPKPGGATSPSSFSKASESEGVPTVTRMHPDKLAWSPR